MNSIRQYKDGWTGDTERIWLEKRFPIVVSQEPTYEHPAEWIDANAEIKYEYESGYVVRARYTLDYAKCWLSTYGKHEPNFECKLRKTGALQEYVKNYEEAKQLREKLRKQLSQQIIKDMAEFFNENGKQAILEYDNSHSTIEEIFPESA